VYRLAGVAVRYEDETALDVASLELAAGEFVAVGGGNGAGKSTLLRVLARLCDEYTGECFLEDLELRAWDPLEFSARVAYVPQGLPVEFPLTAEGLVMRDLAAPDESAAARAMEKTGTLRLRRREFRTLSGGEKQRVLLAAALAREPRALLLDEPVRYLDLARKVEVFRLLRRQADEGTLVVAATHEVNEALACANRVVGLEQGRVPADSASGIPDCPRRP
jgi:iron complex transport system ATP-binding protein